MQTLSRKSVVNIAFAAALIIFVSIGWLAYQNMAAAKESNYWVSHTHTVLEGLDTLLSSLTDAETGQRGFIITGDEAYLAPYNNALSTIPKQLKSLKDLTKDNPLEQKRLNSVDLLAEKKLAELKITIDTKKSQGFQATALIVESHLGKNLMNDIRKVIAEAQDNERQLLLERTRVQEDQTAKTIRVIAAGGGVCLLLLISVYLLLNRELAQRTKAEIDLTAQNEELQKAREQMRLQDWVKTGINELNTKVRGDKHLGEMAGDAVAFLSEYLKVGVSALYLFEERSDTLRIIANYAFTRGKDLKNTIRLGEGLAGEAAREKRPLCLNSIPPDYLVIGSALGEAVPRTILALPLLYDKLLIGVIELGSFDEFSEQDLDFLNQSAEILAIAISVNQTRQQVNELLQQSQSQEEELRVQQEELQQTNEELEERAQLLEEQRRQIQAKNRELETAGREIMLKAREMEQISSYKSEFLANMSHELRTPLNSLMILSGHLKENKEGNLTPKQVEYAATIKSAGNDLLNLINDILDLSKIEAGRLDFTYEEERLVDLCDRIADIFRPIAKQKELKFTTGIEDGTPEKIRLDQQRTLQVLKNLISNAIKFTSQGSVTLYIYTPDGSENPLSVPALAFRVIDTGIGIPVAKHDLIFQAFQQADGSISRKFGGTGLGLSISRQLARGMNGEIAVAGEEGKGSVFTLYLPLSPPESSDSATGTAAKTSWASPQINRPEPTAEEPPLQDDHDRVGVGDRCILIIEDDLTFAKLLMEKVRERGFSAIVATDGNSGIELAEKFHPSAILLDVMLPRLDGFGVMQKITDNLQIRHIPVHFITCIEEKQKAMSMGAIGFVTKPVTGEQLDTIFGAIEDTVSRTLKKLLIVEDDRAHASALVALLEERDISISVAETGEQAIRLLSDEPFDCIVLDLGLADMSGFNLLEHIRNLEQSRHIPVIIHTGQELSAEDTRRLQHYSESIIIKGAKSPERLLNEVTLFLHVMESRLPPHKQRMIRTSLDTETLLAGKKVLLVDDDMRNVFSLSSVLAEKGMLIVEAENGKVALAKLEEHPDVNIVLMDVMMPEMDGYEATRRIRKDLRFARLPIIALTAKAMKGDRQACLEAGASDYITKPVETDRLLSLLRVWLYNQV
ncbi:MAG: response regulator [Oryzomonas sp.]|uniref:response regulator n=1 Tax=Oryzomonas sp. TaxID=2855186 RepID=UPI002848936B|nr:response regulator [Oryzomonas sp.]MDR3580482.1 response regulator [Oryzomonas sp.]